MTGQVWSIGFASGAALLNLRADVAAEPILTAADITDVDAGFVADPFLIAYQDIWYLFFEVWNQTADKGEIGVAASRDLARWTYYGIVLREKWHLSYPHVFAHDGAFWMMPEAIEGGGVHLYRAAAFPGGWHDQGAVVVGAMADPTPFLWDDAWYLFACPGFRTHDDLVLYTSPRLGRGWQPHLASPIRTGDPLRSRPAGRMLVHDGRPLRWAQDCQPRYGSAVRALEILDLTPRRYAERELPESPVLTAGRAAWNRDGMHHLDAVRLADRWVAVVDGWHAGQSRAS